MMRRPNVKFEKRLDKLLTQVARMDVLKEFEERDYTDPGLGR